MAVAKKSTRSVEHLEATRLRQFHKPQRPRKL
jgi:hypothetical protein